MKKQYINFLKFISIILVIFIHCISKAWNASDVNSNMFKVLTFIDSIARVCVPIFAMCSGAIFLNRDDSIKKIIFKYILKIYIIFIIFNFSYKLVDLFIYKDGILNMNILLSFLKDSFLLRSIYHLWYLKIVIIMYAFIPLFKLLINKNKYINHIILLVLFITFTILPMFIKESHFIYICGSFGYLLYFYLGFYLDKYKFKFENIIFCILSIISLIYTYINTINLCIKLNMPNEEYLGYQRINILLMAVFVFILAKHFKYDKISKFLDIEAIHNFNIYLFHGFVIGGLQYLKIINVYKYNNIIMLFINVILVYICCFIISYILKKEKKVASRILSKSNT